MRTEWLDERLRADLVAWRRNLHACPELGFQEHRTAAFVAERLRRFGLEVRAGVAQTGVVAMLGREGPVVLARADMDALPIQEESEVDYRSQTPGVMHACGHDGHTAMLLAVARLLAARTDEIRGRVKFMFQPAEEEHGGALPMVEAGVLTDPPVQAAFACHLWNDLDVGKIGVRSGAMFAATDALEITVSGQGGHGAAPHQTVDAVLAACQVVTLLQSVVSRSVNPLRAAVVTIGAIHGGGAPNIIPPEVRLRGTIRSFEPDVRETVLARVREVAEGVCAAAGARAEVCLTAGYPATVNDPEMVDLVRAAAADVVGWDNVVELDPSMGGEDMAFVLQRVPGAYFAVGSRNEARGLSLPHHNPRFDFDEEALSVGAETMAHVLDATLRKFAR
ncbi:MAG: amidohydrolase [Armatimonadetes bacterium]|nr:amidohydrolase [Armatimonadota bacterium]